MEKTNPPLSFKIHGMCCAEEVTALKRQVGPLVGGEDHLLFDLLNAKMTVIVSGTSVNQQAIVDSIAGIGMRAQFLGDRGAGVESNRRWFNEGRDLLTLASGTFGSFGFAAHAWTSGGILEAFGSEGTGTAHEVPLLARGLYAIGILCGVWVVLPNGQNPIRETPCVLPPRSIVSAGIRGRPAT
jgi:Zn2+/Cd2+-exporting ATPase